MKIRRGQQAGTRYTPHQFANNWISVVESSHTYSPLQVVLEDAAEVQWFLDQDDPMHVGRFWQEWELDREQRIFRRRTEADGVTEQAEENYWAWCEVDRARRVAAIVTSYHAQFVPALAEGLSAASDLAMSPEQVAEQVGKVFQYILAALAGEQGPVKLGIDGSPDTIARVHVAICSPPGGLHR